MDIYFILFKVEPTTDNPYYSMAKGANASFWVLDSDPSSAEQRALYCLAVKKLKVTETEQAAVAVTAEHFTQREVGLASYYKAKRNGIAMTLVGRSHDWQTKAVMKI